MLVNAWDATRFSIFFPGNLDSNPSHAPMQESSNVHLLWHRQIEIMLVSLCFEHSQPSGTISGLKTNFDPSLSYFSSSSSALHTSHFKTNHICTENYVSPCLWDCFDNERYPLVMTLIDWNHVIFFGSSPQVSTCYDEIMWSFWVLPHRYPLVMTLIDWNHVIFLGSCPQVSTCYDTDRLKSCDLFGFLPTGPWAGRLLASDHDSSAASHPASPPQHRCFAAPDGASHSHYQDFVRRQWSYRGVFCHKGDGELPGHQIPPAAVYRLGTGGGGQLLARVQILCVVCLWDGCMRRSAGMKLTWLFSVKSVGDETYKVCCVSPDALHCVWDCWAWKSGGYETYKVSWTQVQMLCVVCLWGFWVWRIVGDKACKVCWMPEIEVL